MTDNRNDDLDFREVTDDEKVDIQNDGTSQNDGANHNESQNSKDDGNKSQFEDVCFVCRRPESKAGKMFHLPNNICICDDCMHRTMEQVSQFDYQNLLNNPSLLNELNKHTGSFPGFNLFGGSDGGKDGFNFGGGIPNS